MRHALRVTSPVRYILHHVILSRHISDYTLVYSRYASKISICRHQLRLEYLPSHLSGDTVKLLTDRATHCAAESLALQVRDLGHPSHIRTCCEFHPPIWGIFHAFLTYLTIIPLWLEDEATAYHLRR